MIQQPVQIPTRGGELEGIVRLPRGQGPFPTVVLVVGQGMTLHEWKGSFDEIAERLVTEGFATVQFAFDVFDKDGNIHELPVFVRASRVEDVLAWTQKQAFVDAGKVGVIGQSYGVATVTAAHLQGVASVVLVSGVYFLYDSLIRVYTQRGTVFNFEGDTIMKRPAGDVWVSKEYWTEAKSFDQLALTKKMSMPVFMVQGDNDKYTVEEEVEAVYNALPNAHKKTKTFQGGDHGINNVPRPMRDEFLADLVAWFKETL